MSACGWPEPSTGIRLPRGQCSHSCSSRRELVELADRALEVLLADLVVGGGHAAGGFFDAGAGSLRRASALAVSRRRRRLPARPARARRRRLRLEELQRLHVERGSCACGRCRRRAATRGTPPGPSKSRIRILTLPSPCATWLSEPAPATIRYLRAKRTASSLKAPDRDARVEDLEDVDVLDHVEQVLVVGHRVHAVERVRARRRGRPGAGSRRSSRPASSRAGSSPR